MEIGDRLGLHKRVFILPDGVNGSSKPQSAHIEMDRWENHSWFGFGSGQ